MCYLYVSLVILAYLLYAIPNRDAISYNFGANYVRK